MFTSRLGNKSPIVRKWIKSADATLMSSGRLPRRVRGVFSAFIVWDHDHFGHRDIDNCVKPLLDYLERLELIENDKMCKFLNVTWGGTREGCIIEIEGDNDA